MFRRLLALVFRSPHKPVIPPSSRHNPTSRLHRRPSYSHLVPPPIRLRSSTIPSVTSLQWTRHPEKDYREKLTSIQNKLTRELQNPESAIWRQDLEIEDKSAYPESFNCRGGLEIICQEDKEVIMKWVRRELIIKGYKKVRVILNGEGRYGSFTVSVEKPEMH